LTATDILSEEN